jgi:thiol-disulfide isomerase/thioredoxin
VVEAVRIERRVVRAGRRLVLAALASAPSALPAQPLALAPGDSAPALTGTVHPGERYFAASWGQFKATLVNFWGTWCAPCRTEMPVLQDLFARRSEDGLDVIGVYDEPQPAQKIDEFLRPLGVQYVILKAGRRVNRDWGGIGVLPTSFLIGPDGKILRRYVGATPEQTAGLVYDIEAVLDGRPLGPIVYPAPPPAAEPAKEPPG